MTRRRRRDLPDADLVQAYRAGASLRELAQAYAAGVDTIRSRLTAIARRLAQQGQPLAGCGLSAADVDRGGTARTWSCRMGEPSCRRRD